MKNTKKTEEIKKETIEYFLERLFFLETRNKDFVFQRELERLSSSLPWEEQEFFFLELKTIAEERGFRIV